MRWLGHTRITASISIKRLLLPSRFTASLAANADAMEPSQDVKRKLESGDGPSVEAPAKRTGASSAAKLVDRTRVRVLKAGPGPTSPTDGPVVYWMSRDQRSADNWALLHAASSAAAAGVPCCVVFNLLPSFNNVTAARPFGFMLRGLQATAATLKEKHNVPFFMLRGDCGSTVPGFCARLRASLLVTDFSPLRSGRTWRDDIARAVSCAFHEVDAHNVVPVWEASPKLEYAARTIRPKIHAKLGAYLVEYPAMPSVPAWRSDLTPPENVDWPRLVAEATADASVPEVAWCVPGEAAAHAALADFLTTRRLKLYEKRNDPNVPEALSGLSPYLHFGQLAPQRAALEAKKHSREHSKAVESFVEELVVRRELSDNFCFYNPNYDTLAGASDWARQSLDAHRGDKREFVYSRQQLEEGRTADRLWNAAQSELVHCGKMHGFMRMYWAKKILEWTADPETALADAIYLNDKYSLDGRDPNGYVGCMWSIAGIHDMGWAERPVFGKIRYMNFAGCKRKFDVERYILRISNEALRVKNAAKAK